MTSRARDAARALRSAVADARSSRSHELAGVSDGPIGFCPLCQTAVGEWVGGASGSTSARCPSCGSIPRQRHLALLLDRIDPFLDGEGAVIEYAPTKLLGRLLVDRVGSRYLGFDIAMHRDVDVLGDAVRLPFAEASIDLAVSFHVLEHIPDDAAAIKEMYRVITPGGFALVQCPYRAGVATDEDPDAPPEERRRRFGLVEHVRFYGDDFTDRLAAPGFHVTLLRAGEYLGDAVCDRHAIPESSPIWFCRR